MRHRKQYWQTPIRQYLLFNSPVLWQKASSEKKFDESIISLREIEKAWVESHIKELTAFAGEWLVIEGEGLVAHNVDFVEAVRAARSRGVQVPYVTRLQLEKVSPFIG
jgi:L-asparaginase/Glu-tRNA(Gln) amidotransferase subunit D